MTKPESGKSASSSQKEPASAASKKEIEVKLAWIGVITVFITAFFSCLGGVLPAFLNSPLAQRLWPPTVSPTATLTTQTPVAFSSLSETVMAAPATSEPLPAPSLMPLPSETATQAPVYKCNVINLLPEENAKIRREQAFKIKFLLVNNGFTVWPEDLELVLASDPGPTLVSTFKPLKVPRVQPGDSFIVGPLEAQAPKTVGKYVISFQLGDGWCWPYVAFEVVK